MAMISNWLKTSTSKMVLLPIQKTVPGTNTTIPYTVDTKVDGGGVTITPSINGTPVPGRTVTLTENGLNNGNNTITNVAPGVNGTDAVNVNQLRNAMHSVDGKIADVGAASAAMAGLKPLQYDPLEPTQVLALLATIKVVLLLLLVSLTIQMNLQCFIWVFP